jgi:hypothetical protein
VVYKPGDTEPFWSYTAKEGECMSVGYFEWGVVIDVAKTREEITTKGHGTTRKIFHGCTVMEDLDEEGEGE